MSSDRLVPFELGRIDRASIKDLALDQLKRYIASGAVGAGQRLPSERELAQRLGVGRNSVREALKALEAVGIVESRVGEGTFITAQTGASIGRTIGLGLATWGGTLVEILKARQMIETGTARVAAQEADGEDLGALEAELVRMETATDAPYRYLSADMNFHRLIARATHNSIVAGIVGNLIDLLEEVLSEANAHQIVTVAEGTATHRDIYAAIAGRDSTAAAHAMRVHLQFSTELWAAVTSLGGANTPPAEDGDAISPQESDALS